MSGAFRTARRLSRRSRLSVDFALNLPDARGTIPKVRRRLISILAALSGMLFVATCVFWVRSFHRYDEVQRIGPSGLLNVTSLSGGLTVARLKLSIGGTKSEASHSHGPLLPDGSAECRLRWLGLIAAMDS